MNLAYSNEYSDNSEYTIRKNYIDVWEDLFLYASNLNGNWLASQEIFHRHLTPTAESNPKLFAKWVNDMVKISGIKIRYRSTFSQSLRLLRSLGYFRKEDRSEVKKALVGLFSSGLDEPEYAQKAISNIKDK